MIYMKGNQKGLGSVRREGERIGEDGKRGESSCDFAALIFFSIRVAVDSSLQRISIFPYVIVLLRELLNKTRLFSICFQCFFFSKLN